jgi:hypothetical protein
MWLLLLQGTKFIRALGTLKNSLMGPLRIADEPVTTVSTIRVRSSCEAGAGSLKRVTTSTSASGFCRTNVNVRERVPCVCGVPGSASRCRVGEEAAEVTAAADGARGSVPADPDAAADDGSAVVVLLLPEV